MSSHIVRNGKQRSRLLGKKLVQLADNDYWKACLAILIDNDRQKDVCWLGAMTEQGDGLVHLASYACCDEYIKLEQRQYAYECLTCIIDADFTCVNRIAGDGGSPLLCAMAAAATSSFSLTTTTTDDRTHNSNDDYNDRDSSDDEDSDNDISDDDEISMMISKERIMELEEQISDYKLSMSSCSSEELISASIQLLLENNADPNVPLANLHHISNHINEDEDEMELAYSRESVIEQWTPLTLCLSWISSFHSSNNNTNRQHALSLVVLNLLLIHDANPTFPMGANSVWTCLEFCASRSNQMSQQILSIDIIQLVHQLYLKLISSSTTIARRKMTTNNDDNNNEPLFPTSLKQGIDGDEQIIRAAKSSNIYDTVWRLLISTNKNKDAVLSPIQSFIVAILTNDYKKTASIVEEETDVIPKWRNTFIDTILPIKSTSFWSSSNINNNNDKRMTLLDVCIVSCCRCLAAPLTIAKTMTTFDLIIGPSYPPPTWEQLKRAAKFMFLCNHHQVNNKPHHNESTNNMESYILYHQKQETMFLKLLHELDRFCVSLSSSKETAFTTKLNDSSHGNYPKTRQTFLDVLLLESCSNNSTTSCWGLPYALPILLKYGANPKATSIVKDYIQRQVSPLHFISSNIRGQEGIDMAQHLLFNNNNNHDNIARKFYNSNKEDDDNNIVIDYSYLYEITSTGERPIDISLKKRNFVLSEYLWKLEQEQEGVPCSSKDSIIWDVNKCFLLGEASIQCKNLKMLQYSIDTMCCCCDNLKREENKSTINKNNDNNIMVSQKMGQLLLWIVDERSGLGNDDLSVIEKAVQIIYEKLNGKNKNNKLLLRQLPSFARDAISGHTPLHLLLRQNRGVTLRKALLPCLCQIMSLDDDKSNHIHQSSSSSTSQECHNDNNQKQQNKNNLVSIPSASKFGGYTALHLACSLKCLFSIQILVNHNAFLDAKDSNGKRPIDHLPKDLQLEWSHLLSCPT